MPPPSNNPYGYKRLAPAPSINYAVMDKKAKMDKDDHKALSEHAMKHRHSPHADFKGNRVDVHTFVGVVYVIFLLVLTFFWPSISFILLTSIHVFLFILVLSVYMGFSPAQSQMEKMGMKGTKLDGYASASGTAEELGGWQSNIIGLIFGTYSVVVDVKDGASTSKRVEMRVFPMPHGLDLIAFHLRNPYNNWMNMIHIIVLLLNFVAFLAVTYNESPPSSLLIPEKAYDHTTFGVVPLEGSKGAFEAIPERDMHLVQLAQKGYYYAEEYVGYYGANPLTPCNGTEWTCYSVGVRHYLGEQEKQNSFYQPLPSPAYSVDVQVAVSMGGSNDAVDACSTLPNIFIQHVSGQGNVIGPYRPIVDFAWNNPTNETMCPTPSVIGCVANQRQPLAAYTASLRKFCSTMKKIHSSDGAPYVASYINIPGELSTIDERSGGIRHTILIMPTRAGMKPPILRVTPKQVTTGVPLRTLFTPIGMWKFPRSGDINVWQGQGSGYQAVQDLRFAQQYGDNAPHPDLKRVDIPAEYIRTNYNAMFWAYVSFFIIPIMIAWYYLVTIIFDYHVKPFVYTALFVRVPLLLLGIYVGSWSYYLAQILIVVAYVTRAKFGTVKRKCDKTVWDYNSVDSGMSKFLYMGLGYAREKIFILLLLLSVVFNLVHFAHWVNNVTSKKDLMTFSKYVAETAPNADYNPAGVYHEYSPNLFVPLFTMFLTIEPAMTGIIYALVILANFFRYFSATRQ